MYAANSLLWREWGSEVAIYQPSSGKTHFLNLLGATILEIVELSSDTRESAIAKQAADGLELQTDDNFEIQVADLLHSFEHLGLVASTDTTDASGDL